MGNHDDPPATTGRREGNPRSPNTATTVLVVADPSEIAIEIGFTAGGGNLR